MTIVGIIALIKGVIEFPGIILEFVKLLQKTPQDKHEDILGRIRKEAESFEETGRPTW